MSAKLAPGVVVELKDGRLCQLLEKCKRYKRIPRIGEVLKPTEPYLKLWDAVEIKYQMTGGSGAFEPVGVRAVEEKEIVIVLGPMVNGKV
jgi:hypothetical protein